MNFTFVNNNTTNNEIKGDTYNNSVANSGTINTNGNISIVNYNDLLEPKEPK